MTVEESRAIGSSIQATIVAVVILLGGLHRSSSTADRLLVLNITWNFQVAVGHGGWQQAGLLPCNVPLLLAVWSLLIGAAFCLLFFGKLGNRLGVKLVW